MQLFPVPSTTVVLRLTWPLEEAVTLMQLWQDFAPSAPDELSSELEFHTSNGGILIAVHAMHNNALLMCWADK